jgi:hypothetical protein
MMGAALVTMADSARTYLRTKATAHAMAEGVVATEQMEEQFA